MINGHKVVMAPSGTGKSTLAKTHPDMYIDGDAISFAKVKAAYFDLGPDPWWKNRGTHPDVGRFVTAVQSAFLEALEQDKTGRTVLWALVLGGDDMRIESKVLASIDAMVIPPPAILVMRTKERDERITKKGLKNKQPVVNQADAAEVVKFYARMARDRSIPEYGSFDAVPKV